MSTPRDPANSHSTPKPKPPKGNGGGKAQQNNGGQQGNLNIDQFLAGLRQTEHGVYDWQDNGAGAYGAYQILASNWPQWAQEAGVDPNDHSQAAQDKVAHYKVNQYYKDYHDWSLVAAAWFGGAGNVQAWKNGEDRSDGNIKTSEYISRVLTNAGASPENVSAAVGSGGGGGDGVAGGAAGNTQLTPADISASLDSMGFPKGLIESHHTLRKAFNQILQDQLDLSTGAGQARAMQILKSTKWWQDRSKSQREFDTRMADPSEQKSLQQDIKAQRSSIQAAAQHMGVDLNDQQLDHLAHISLRNNLNDAELNHALARHFTYNANQPQTGTASADINGLQQLAQQYYVNIGPGHMQQLIRQMLNGQLQPQDVVDYIKAQAASRFPHLEKQINQGFTIDQIAAPYVQAYSDILGTNPAGIGHRDPLLMQALQMPDGKGGFQLMPEWQFEQQLRKDPRWLSTPDAHQSLVGTGIQVLKDWGLA